MTPLQVRCRRRCGDLTGARAYAVMTYDPGNPLVYLFGGVDGDGSTRNDLWVFSRDDVRCCCSHRASAPRSGRS